MDCLVSELTSECLHVHTGVVEIGVDVHALHLKVVGEVVDVLGHLVVVHDLGNVRLDKVDKLVDELVVGFVLRLVLRLLEKLLAEILLVFVKGIKFADVLGKLVVQLGKLGHLDLVDLDLEHGGLTCQLFRVVLLREGDVHIEFLADLMTDHALLEAGDELVGTELQGVFLRLAALEGNAVAEAFIVKYNAVAHLSGSVVDVDASGVALLKML